MANEKKDAPQTIPNTPAAFFWYVTKPQWLIASMAVLLVTVAAISQISVSYIFKLIVDAAEAGSASEVMRYALLYPVVVLVYELLWRGSGYFGARYTIGAGKYATDRLHEYLIQHDYTYFSNRFAGSLSSKVRNVTEAIGELIPSFLWGHLGGLVSLIASVIYISHVDVRVSLLLVALVGLLVVINQLLAKEKQVRSRVAAEARSKFSGYAIDVLTNASVVRNFVRERYELKNLEMLTEDVQQKHLRNWIYTEKVLLINSLLLFVFAGLMFWSLADKWTQGIITTGDFVLVVSLFSGLTGQLLFISRALNQTARTVGEMKEGLDTVLVEHAIVDQVQAKELVVKEADITFDAVTFTYGNSDVFNNLSLKIQASERIGLVGASGAGKSTFVSLLLRQYELTSGRILIGGQDIKNVTQDSLREAIAFVPQEPALFHRTIKENIAYGNLDATDSEIQAIAKKAYAHDFIQLLPHGYDTLVGERGVKLSGGQKQRIAIARAMLKNSPILVLDEATSALDSESETEIQKALHELMKGKTVIAIAHRLSTLRELDRILVLEGGIIVEDGSHNDLVQKNALYARLWKHQSGGFM